MKRNTHCIVPEADFRLLQGEQDLSCYKASSYCCVRWLSWLCAGAHVALKVLLCYSRLMLQFNTMTAAHLFCKHCGICAFYRPRSNPDGYAGARACVAEWVGLAMLCCASSPAALCEAGGAGSC